MKSKLKVLLHGPLLSLSGYGVLSRQVARWLETRDDFEVKYRITPWGVTSWLINEKLENGLIGTMMKKSNVWKDEYFDVSIQNILPNEWTTPAKFNIGMSAVVETDVMNPEWITDINKMDLVIVPSQHCKTTIEKTSSLTGMEVKTKVLVVPEAFPDEVFAEDIPELPLELETDFNFLIFGQITSNKELADRKNTYKTLKWLCEIFRNDKDVGIVIKTNCSRGTTYDRRHTEELLTNYLSNIRKNNTPRIYLLHGDMTTQETMALYRHPKIKALVSLSAGEGWNLPALEAAASDLPVIATNWSGHLDFLGKGKFIPIDYDLVEIDKSRIDGKIFVPGAKWAQPRELSAKKALKKFRESSVIPKEWAVDLGQKVREEFSQNQINKHYDIIIQEYLKI